jgi:uncharacterized membrane protein
VINQLKTWIMALGAGVAIFVTVYLKGRRDASAKQISDSNRRLRNAIEADTRARERIARGELLNDDGHKRPD